MHRNTLKYLASIIFMLAAWTGANAQAALQTYLDIGKSQVSEGVFIKNVHRGNYKVDRFCFEAGMQFDLLSSNPNVLTGFDLIGSGEFLMKEFPFEVSLFFMLNRFSDLDYGTDWGIRIETRKFEHFFLVLGTNFKTYAINATAREDFGIKRSESKLRENFNLIYILTVYAKPYQNHWNIGLSCTNVDYYVINQSTNPVFHLQLRYTLLSGITLYLDSWLQQAGIFNIYAGHFGYFFRTGVVWEIGK